MRMNYNLHIAYETAISHNQSLHNFTGEKQLPILSIPMLKHATF